MGPVSSGPSRVLPSRASVRAWSRGLLIRGLVVALTYAAIEGLAWLGYWAVTKAPLRLAEVEAKRTFIIGSAETLYESARGRREITPVVPHPFLGFVYNPDFDPIGVAQRHTMPVSAWGFLDDKSPIVERRPDQVVVGIFGGSVAYWLSVKGIGPLLDELHRVPELRSKRIVVVRTALGGSKQPQHLAALAYLLALGAHFDVVVNLDGVNEVSPGPGDTFPAFPRSWPGLMGETRGLQSLRLVGEITFERKDRATWADRFTGPWLRRSPLGSLVWWVLDRRIEGRIEAAQDSLSRQEEAAKAGGLSFGARGPAWPAASEHERYEHLAAIWRGSSLQMHRLCSAAGIRYHHFLQPSQYVAGSKPMNPDERKRALMPGSLFDRGARSGYPLLQEAGRDLAGQGVAFVDLTGVFTTESEPLYTDTCCHLNSRGNALLGRAMGRAIAERWAAPRAANR